MKSVIRKSWYAALIDRGTPKEQALTLRPLDVVQLW